MHKQREALRYAKTTTMSNRMIGKLVGVSRTTVANYRNRIDKLNLNWPDIEKLNDKEIERLVKGSRKLTQSKREPDLIYTHNEMQKPHVTAQLLWEEYSISDPKSAYSYSSFTHKYNTYVKKLDLSMRQPHRAGESIFVDYAGKTIPYTDPETGDERTAQIFIGVMGASKYTFAYASRSQKVHDWIDAHNKMYWFFGGVTQNLVSDCLKSAVISSNPEIILNRSYLEQAKHYNTIVLPARPRRPKDKSDAEIGVLIFTRWITAKLRNHKFFSIDEINTIISELLKELNERPFKKLPGCRRSRFEELDQPMLRPLPGLPFEYATWIAVRKVTKDYHLPVDSHSYSVPHELVGQKVETRITKNVVEFFSLGKRIANHPRSYVEGGYSTSPQHQSKEHRAYANLTPENLIEWAKKIGPSSLDAVQYQLTSRPHAVLGLKPCATLQKLVKEYGENKFEAACERAKTIGSLSVTSIKSILKRRLVDLADDQMPIQINLPLHQNVRGSDYYTNRSPL